MSRRKQAPAESPLYSERLTPPTMTRSRVQTATAYSPGTLFTFEGGRGICLSVPVSQPRALSTARANMVFDGIGEFVKNWLERARRGINEGVEAELCVDQCFIRPGTKDEVLVDRIGGFETTEPSIVGYEPYPLVFQCMSCSRLFEPENVESLARLGSAPCKCGARDSWRQVDVVFAHWSGEIEPLSPSRYWWNEKELRVDRHSGCTCGGDEFYLVNKSPSFSDWSFRCASCGTSKELYQLSRLTAQTLEPKRGRTDSWRDPIRLDENMLPVSYRASSLHYVQSGRFIAVDGLDGGSWMGLFSPGREAELLREVAGAHQFAMLQPEWPEIRDALVAAGRDAECRDLEGKQQAIQMLRTAPGMSAAVADLQKGIEAQLAALRNGGVIPGPTVDSARLTAQLRRQAEWSRRFNPIRLTVEHRAFRREHIDDKAGSRAVDVLKPDRRLYQLAESPEDLREYSALVGALLRQMGVAEMVLVRGLPVVEYTFGFTRVSSTPVYERTHGNGKRQMPVRMCAFPKMYNGRRPIYVMEQKNEALYVRLQEATVREWLTANGMPLDPAVPGIGAAYIEQYEDFGEFLDVFKVRDAGRTTRTVSNYVYSLLHTLSHAFVHAIADLSGLDADGVGEHIYPADLAFVVYRKGMTPDLGNISATWRNRHRQLLESVLSARRLRCGSGSLCDNRGGACPACIMVPDIGCIAHNQLLSRAMLAGGRAPTWDSSDDAPIRGYLECVEGRS